MNPGGSVKDRAAKAMVEGDFARAYTDADNSTSTSTDTIKNIVNVVARENLTLSTEEFCQVLAKRYLDLYPQVTSATVTAHETKWNRLTIDGKPHPHSFTLDSNGKPFVEVVATRSRSTMRSGIDSFTFMKSTQSGWENFFADKYSTIKPTNDRMCATAMVASWAWSSKPSSYPLTNARIMDKLIEVFATTYSPSVQNSLFHMGEAALAGEQAPQDARRIERERCAAHDRGRKIHHLELGRLAEQLRKAVASNGVAGGLDVTMSFGVGASQNGQPFDYPEVFQTADAALYRAKREGRDRVCRADAETAPPAIGVPVFA